MITLYIIETSLLMSSIKIIFYVLKSGYRKKLVFIQYVNMKGTGEGRVERNR